MSRPAFLDQEAPKGYVAGIGRGATGFTTSADTGAVRIEDDIDDDGPKIDDDSGLLARRGKGDAAEEEADKIYEDIERRLLEKKRKKNEQLVEKPPSDDPVSQFVDLKRDLSQVTRDQWAALPEVGDLTRRNKRMRLLEKQQQRFYAVPDSVLTGLGSSQATNFASISQGKDKLLSQRLDELLPQAQTTTDAIEEQDSDMDSQIADVNRTRLVLNSLRRTAPNKASSWIASIRVEEQAKNFSAAKRLAVQACQKVPQSEEVWLESIRIHQKSLQSSYECKTIANSGLKFNPKSLGLWLKLYDLESNSDTLTKRKVLMRAIENLPRVPELWKKLVQQEESAEEKRKLALKAVELCPLDWDLRRILVSLSDYKESKSILNEARKIMGGNPQLWITAVELEEKHNPEVLETKLLSMMKKGMGEVLKVEDSDANTDWIKYAMAAEDENYLKTCHALAKAAFHTQSEVLLDLPGWIQKAQDASKSHKNTAKFIYQAIVEKFPNDTDIWLLLFESLKGEMPTLVQHYKHAIELNPREELFRLMYAKDLWKLAGDVDGARSVLISANNDLPQSEEIWLAMAKLEIMNKRYKDAGVIFKRALDEKAKDSPRIWYKYVHYQRYMYYNKEVSSDKILEAVEEALNNFPQTSKLHLQKSQILMLDINDPQKARLALSQAVKICPQSVPLWTSLSQLEEVHFKNLLKARSTLDLALLKNPNSDLLWVHKVQLEVRAGDAVAASQICSRALQKFPSSPMLWVQQLSLITKLSQKKNSFLDALQKTNNSSEVLVEIGRSFYMEGKYSKAEQWFQRAVDAESENGDAWSWLYKVLGNLGKSDRRAEISKKVDSLFDSISKGVVWIKCKKDPKNLTCSGAEILDTTARVI